MTARTRLESRRAVLGAVALAGAIELLPGAPAALVALAGLWLLVGAPTVLWYGAASRAVSTRDGCVLIAVGLGIITDIVVALAVNTVLPLAGVAHPLAHGPLLGASVLALLVLALAAPLPSRSSESAARSRADAFSAPPGLVAVSAFGAVTLALSVAGAIRLNNQLGSAVGVVALVSNAALLTLLVARRRHYPTAVLELGLFCAAAALLLLTSLRGWYITGHDIQREYEVFQLTATADHWSIAAFQDPYNACLSITLLPTSLARLTGIPGTYVFKVLLPLFFALAPVLVYRSVRNVAPQLVALLSAVYFMAFPTFFTDMTFLGRQEIAFVLLGGTMVVITDTARPLRSRQVMVTVLLAGIVLSHYSTTYVVMAVLGLAFCTDLGWRLLRRQAWPMPRRRARSRAAGSGERPAVRGFVTWWMLAATAAAAVLWTGPVTHTTGQLHSTLSKTVQGLLGGQSVSGSSDTSYSLFGGTAVSPAQRLTEYRAATVSQTTTERAAGGYASLNVIDAYATPVVQQQDLPLTLIGRTLQQHGIDVTAANGFVRQTAARLLQLLLLLGVATTVLGRRRAFRPSRDQVTLTVGMLVVIGLLTVLPQLSVDYGVLRAFQQGLFVFAPFVVAGSMWVCRWAGRLAAPIACSLALAFFLDLTGAVPQVLGGYPAQLNLDNSGQYYDIYYVHPEERTAIAWLDSRTSADELANVHSEVQTDRYTFGRLQTLIRGRAQDDIYPTLVGVRSYVFLGTTTVQKGEATTFYQGDLVTYRYPVAFLDVTKDELYSSEGAEIYR
ncbi:putative membrane protein DUF2206 [Streptomyces sp. 846.5]|nr:DUF2206 domain-containing protein [Streptomyces sp. 846.5]TDT98544.1 putative membrane protein DUF2206 [Streptomyces sp. 846.5]